MIKYKDWIHKRAISKIMLIALTFIFSSTAITVLADESDLDRKDKLPNTYAKNIGVYLNHPTAYVLPRGSLEASLIYHEVNETLDFLDIRNEQLEDDNSQELLDLTGDIGDLRGLQFTYDFGLHRDFSLFSLLQHHEIKYGSETVDIERFELGSRYQVLTEQRFGVQLGVDLQALYLRGSGIKDRFQTIKIDSGDTETEVTFKEPQSIEFGGLKTERQQFRVLLSRHLFHKLYAHLFVGYRHTQVQAEINLSSFLDLGKIFNRYQYESETGIAFDWKIWNIVVLHGLIERIQIKRFPEVPAAPEDNLLVNGEVIVTLTDNIKFILLGRYFDNFLTGEVPFLLNSHTAWMFPKKYGYAGIGIIINTDYE